MLARPVRLMEKSLAEVNAAHVQKGNDWRKNRMKFVCLGFIDEAKFAEIPPDQRQRMMEQCFAYDDELRRGGHFLGGEASIPLVTRSR